MNDFNSMNPQSDDEEDDRSSVSPLGITWEANVSSSSCTLCNKPFGRLTKRRHHCRYCGRLVCGSCSKHRVQLQNHRLDPSASGENDRDALAKSSSPAGSAAPNLQQPPVRVCDPCFLILTVKEEKIIEKRHLKEKKAELLTSTSYISNCLVEVYFLDGSHVTVSYDESTTVLELAQYLYPVMKVALFEVIEDIYDSKQYVLLMNSVTIAAVVDLWQKTGQKFAKLVFPVTDAGQIKNPLSGLKNSLKETLGQGTAVGKDFSGIGSPFKSSTAPANTPDAELSILQAEIDRLQYELDKANRKLETWRGLLSKTNRSKALEAAEITVVSSQDAISDSLSVMDMNDQNDNATVISTATQVTKAQGRRSSFSWKALGEVRTSIKSSLRNSIIGGSNANTNNDKGKNNGMEDGYDVSNQHRDVLLSAAASAFAENNLEERQTISAVGKRSNASNLRGSMVGSSPPLEDGLSSPSSNLLSGSLEELKVIIGNLNFGSNNTEMEILNQPTMFLRKEDSEVTLFVRTYFNHMVNLMSFFTKYGNFFQQTLKMIKARLIDDGEREEQLRESEGIALGNEGRGGADGDEVNSQLFCKWITSIYHMIVTMDIVYEQILDYYETLRPALKQWLIVLFPQSIVLPISDPDKVKSVMGCLIKENMLLDPMILTMIQQAITNCIFHKLSFLNASSSSSSGRSRPLQDLMKQLKQQLQHRTLSFSEVLSPLMKNILMTCQYIIGDYLQIFPSDIPVMQYFQNQSYEIWNTLIKPYYRDLSSSSLQSSSSSSLSVEESSLRGQQSSFFSFLEIYLFLEKYMILMDKFGDRQLKDQFIERLKEKKIELIGLLTSALVQELRMKMRSLSLSQSRSGFEIAGDIEQFQQIMKRVAGDDQGGTIAVGSGVSASGVGNSSSISSGGSGNGKLQSRRSMPNYSAADATLEDNAKESSVDLKAGLFSLSSQYPLFHWPMELFQYLSSLFEAIFTQQDYINPLHSNTTKGNIQITFLTIIFETLLSEFLPLPSDYLHHLKATDKVFLLKMIAYLNSNVAFLSSFFDYLDSFFLNYNAFSNEIIENYFEDKLSNFYQSMMETNQTAMEILCRNYFFHEIKQCFASNLFNSFWLKDMKGILLMKKVIRAGLLQINSLLLPSIAPPASSGSSGSGSIANNGSAGGEADNDDSGVPGLLSGTNMLAIQNLPEFIKHKVLVTIIEGIISLYLELLFTHGFQNFSKISVEVIDRLSEDLQMITSFFEELRQIILQNQYYSQNIHIISGGRKKGSRFSVSPAGSGAAVASKPDQPAKQKKRSFFSSASTSRRKNPGVIASNGSSSDGPRKELIVKNLQNKQLFDELLFPLQHIIYAIQMNRQHLLEFVKNELFNDFGYINALRIWQLLAAWRGIQKEEIIADYDTYFKDWRPNDAQNIEPKLFLPYLINHKTNILKITKQGE